MLIVDDASPDGSARSRSASPTATRGSRRPATTTNAGHIRTYNDGLAKAKGDYVALVSADDLLTPDCLTRAAALMEAHPRVGLVYGFAALLLGRAAGHRRRQTRNWSVWDRSRLAVALGPAGPVLHRQPGGRHAA